MELEAGTVRGSDRRSACADGSVRLVVGLGAAAGSASATQLVLLLVAVEAAVRSCDTFGCAFVVEPLGVVAALVVAATIGYLVLRVARVAKALPAAATAGVAVGPAWVFGFGLGSPTLSMALLIGVGPAAYGLGYLLYARSPLPVPLTLTITVALLVASVVPAGALGQRVDDSRYRNAEQHRLEKFAQPIYLPATVPSRYSFHSGTLHPADRIGEAFYEATYLFDKNNSGDPSPFTLLSFRTLPSFVPPTRCGPESPTGHAPSPCHAIAAGPPVLYATDPANAYGIVYYRLIGDTEVTLTGGGGQRGITQDQAVHILSSVTARSPIELRALQEHH